MKSSLFLLSLLLLGFACFCQNENINLVPNAINGYKLLPLDSTVNSLDYEALPVVSADGRTLYFVRKPSVGDEDIWFSEKNTSNQWEMAENIGLPLNNSGHNGVLSVTADGNTVFLLNTYEKDGSVKGSGLSRSTRSTKGWTVPKDVNIKNYYNRAFGFANFAFSSNRQVIISSMQRDDTHGVQDLYICFRINDSTYTEPVNLGPLVNSSELECSPFIAADDRTLYFSSAGHPGYGENDMFLTRRLDDTWLNWSTPQNLGPELNSAGWEGFYSIPASGDFAYLVSRKDRNSQGDIFKIQVAESARPDPVVLISGTIRTPDQRQLHRVTLTYFDQETGEELGTYEANPEDERYQVLLPRGKKYRVFVRALDKAGLEVGTINVELDASKLSSYQEIEQNLVVIPKQETKVEISSDLIEEETEEPSIPEIVTDDSPQEVVEPTVEDKMELLMESVEPVEEIPSEDILFDSEIPILYFDQGKSALRKQSIRDLDRLIDFLKKEESLTVLIEGHTDNAGTRKDNVKLGMSRAKKVRAYLFSHGIATTRLSTQTFGDLRPTASNRTAKGMQLNRRVVFQISGQ
ncbi:MAG: OmpA family protein [Bacteroidota bacterium]